MATSPRPLRGRGASDNPPNRFERLRYEPDPDAGPPVDEEDAPLPRTEFYKDSSRSVIARNESPDVGFEASINPYRGCEHGCVYCLSGDTPILMADGSTRLLEAVRTGDRIYGTTRRGWYRRYVTTRVLAHWAVKKQAYRITLEDGTELIAGRDHRFLTERGWKFVVRTEPRRDQRAYLTTNNKLMGVGRFTPLPRKDEDYKAGYLCGMIRGDGLLGSYSYVRPGRVHGDQHQFRLALADEDALERASGYLRDFHVPTHGFVFQEESASRRLMRAIRTHARQNVERVKSIIAWPTAPMDQWSRGFLAGIFDAEGSYSGGILRITNTDPIIVEATTDCLKRLGLAFVVERRVRPQGKDLMAVRLRGGLRAHLRFFHTSDPGLARKRDIEGQAVKGSAKLRVVSIEPLGVRRLFDITTGTGDFISDGVISHNCYARPTHEYLGFSSGLDFETKILVKEDAPELLRRELSAPGWKPTVLALSGVTDPYQPVERRLRLTRRCLEVLADLRNPVAIVTKNHLVTRDVDLLRELARWNACVVFVSVTTLRKDLQKIMEPRTSSPEKRLGAIRALADAGVPAGVLVAPVIPALTDHEIPAIVDAARAAGARQAGYVILRLPHALVGLFETWLEHHFPDRKEKVLNRIRAVRGGKLNDPRFGSRMRGEGVFADEIASLFRLALRKAGIDGLSIELSTSHFRRPGYRQLTLFDLP